LIQTRRLRGCWKGRKSWASAPEGTRTSCQHRGPSVAKATIMRAAYGTAEAVPLKACCLLLPKQMNNPGGGPHYPNVARPIRTSLFAAAAYAKSKGRRVAAPASNNSPITVSSWERACSFRKWFQRVLQWWPASVWRGRRTCRQGPVPGTY
jgi:hypothetical protein